ncbi:hypothetical protein OS42_47280 [Dickeya oryzae]
MYLFLQMLCAAVSKLAEKDILGIGSVEQEPRGLSFNYHLFNYN